LTSEVTEKTYSANEFYEAMLKMKQAKYSAQMSILDIILRREQAELEIKLLKMETEKRNSPY
jgi:chaperone required for assembly of F1-ATPase